MVFDLYFLLRDSENDLYTTLNHIRFVKFTMWIYEISQINQVSKLLFIQYATLK